MFQSHGSEVIGELTTSQEEADTRTLLHAKHASSHYRYMVIVAEDTDVIIICLPIFRQKSDNMYIPCGTKNRLCHIDSSKVEQTLGGETCKALQGRHAFTRCDSIGAFSGRRKVSALKLVIKWRRLQNAMEGFGKTRGLSEELFTCCKSLCAKFMHYKPLFAT